MEFTSSLFSTKVHNGRRTFFFDVKSSKNNNQYIKICESSLTKEGEKQRNYMTIFPSELAEFKQAVDEVAGYMEKQTK